MEPNLNSSNHYEVLGIEQTCEVRDIKIAYRRLAKKYHPDKNKTPEAHKSFVAVSRAYEILSNEDDRHQYDKTLGASKEFTFNYSDFDLHKDLEHWANMFDTAFKPAVGEDVNVYCRLSLKELKVGCKKVITLASGKISITIKDNTAPNTTLKVEGKGNTTPECSVPGDLYIKLVPKPDPKFKLLDSGDIQVVKNISYQDIVLGTSLVLETLVSKIKIKIPKLTPINQEFRLRGLGLAGKDFILKLNLLMPNSLTEEETQVVSKLNNYTNLKCD